MHTACVWSEKLPFAEYSVVKDAASAPGASARPGRASRPVENSGGEYRARTGDLLVANQALSQLS